MSIDLYTSPKKEDTQECPALKPDGREQTVAEDVPRLGSTRSISIIASTSMAMLLNICGFSAMAIALPTIGRDLAMDADSLQWLVTAYSLTSGCLLLLFGRLADVYTGKTVFLAGTIWLIAFSIGCGLSQNGLTLIIMRALAGMGPAATVPASIGILAKTFPPSHARNVAFATFQSGAPIGSAFGSILGGILTQYVPVESWRVVFFVIAGLAVPILVCAFLSFPSDDRAQSEDGRVDWVGGLLITSGLVVLVFCLGQGEIAPQGWNTAYIIALLVLSGLLICAFVAWEHYIETRTTRPPLMRLDLWTRANGKFAALQLLAFLVYAAFTTWSYWVTLYYQSYLGLPPIQTMLRFLPCFINGLLITVVFGLVVGRVPGQLLIVIGCLGVALANLLFAVISTGSPYWAFGFPAALSAVFGADLIMPGGSLFGASVALPHEQSLAGGVFNTVTQIGTAFGMTVTTIVYDRVVRTESARQGVQLDQYATNAPSSAILLGYRMAQWTLFAFAMTAALIALIALRNIGIIGAARRKPDSVRSSRSSEMPAVISDR